MTESAPNTFESARVAVPAFLDWLVNTTGPTAFALGGVSLQLLYAGLAILSAQLWRWNSGFSERRNLPGPPRGQAVHSEIGGTQTGGAVARG
jgi:hypothetical protein